jgi:hypothetical protein
MYNWHTPIHLSRNRVLNSGGPFKVAVSVVPADAHRSPQKTEEFSTTILIYNGSTRYVYYYNVTYFLNIYQVMINMSH